MLWVNPRAKQGVRCNVWCISGVIYLRIHARVTCGLTDSLFSLFIFSLNWFCSVLNSVYFTVSITLPQTDKPRVHLHPPNTGNSQKCYSICTEICSVYVSICANYISVYNIPAEFVFSEPSPLTSKVLDFNWCMCCTIFYAAKPYFWAKSIAFWWQQWIAENTHSFHEKVIFIQFIIAVKSQSPKGVDRQNNGADKSSIHIKIALRDKAMNSWKWWMVEIILVSCLQIDWLHSKWFPSVCTRLNMFPTHSFPLPSAISTKLWAPGEYLNKKDWAFSYSSYPQHEDTEFLKNQWEKGEQWKTFLTVDIS